MGAQCMACVRDLSTRAPAGAWRIVFSADLFGPGDGEPGHRPAERRLGANDVDVSCVGLQPLAGALLGGLGAPDVDLRAALEEVDQCANLPVGDLDEAVARRERLARA